VAALCLPSKTTLTLDKKHAPVMLKHMVLQATQIKVDGLVVGWAAQLFAVLFQVFLCMV
jgi:hypothetical protein